MIVYRLVKSRYSDDLSGKGAENCGGRWNSLGVPVLYACQSRALAMAEVAVHVPLGILPQDYILLTLYLPDEGGSITLPVSKFPPDWNHYPPISSTQRIGDAFIKEAKYLAMQVPSAVVQEDFITLINPYHSSFHQIKVLNKSPFIFDRRLFQ